MKAIILMASVFFISAVADLSSVRQKYLAAVNSAAATEELFKMTESTDENSKEYTMVAYKAAAITLQAKFAKGMLSKKNLFTKGAKLLEATLEKAPDNYEARLLRLSIQENAPKITGYNKKIAEDKAFLLKNYKSQEAGLREFTKNFTKSSVSFSKEEKAAF